MSPNHDNYLCTLAYSLVSQPRLPEKSSISYSSLLTVTLNLTIFILSNSLVKLINSTRKGSLELQCCSKEKKAHIHALTYQRPKSEVSPDQKEFQPHEVYDLFRCE